MYKSMYDILNQSIDYNNEYDKLWDMIFTERYYQYNGVKYSLTDIFNKFIVLWKYKGTKCSTEEVLDELEIVEYPKISVEEAGRNSSLSRSWTRNNHCRGNEKQSVLTINQYNIKGNAR